MGYSERFWNAFAKRTRYWAYLSEKQIVSMADYALTVARFESADFSSNVFVVDNNAIGYKYYSGSSWQSGKGLQSPEGDNYAKYAILEDCAAELADWVHRRKGSFQVVEDYRQFVDAMAENKYFGISAADYYSRSDQYYRRTDTAGLSDAKPSPIQEGLAEFGSGNFRYWLVLIAVIIAVFYIAGIPRFFRRTLKRGLV